MVYSIIANRQCVTASNLSIPPNVDWTQAVDARGFNAARFDIVILAADAILTVEVQGSDDLENWTTLTSLGGSFDVGFALPAAVTGIGVAYLRLQAYGGDGFSLAILAAGVNLTNI